MISFGPQFVLMVWSFHVMITWKQRQHDLTHRWGTMKYQENETPRPQFNGKYKICEVQEAESNLLLELLKASGKLASKEAEKQQAENDTTTS